MNKSKRNEKVSSPKEILKLLIFVLILAVPITIGYLGSENEKDQITKYEQRTKGVIVQIDDLLKRGDVAVYQFTVNGNNFKGSQNLPQGNELRVGDSVEVVYSSKNPENNIIIIE
jgi:hypothetical protein